MKNHFASWIVNEFSMEHKRICGIEETRKDLCNLMINIVMSSDNNYAKILYTAIESVLDTCKQPQECCLYIIDNGIEANYIKAIQCLVGNYSAIVNFLDFTDEICSLKLDGKFPNSAFGRLFIGRISAVDRAIYMDCDMIAVSDISLIWNTDLNGYVIGGVQDSVNRFFREIIGLRENDRYINSGLLLIDVKKWRQKNYEKKSIRYIQDNDGHVPHNDQGVINAVCRGDIKVLPCNYNLQNPMLTFNALQISSISKAEVYYTDEELKDAIQNPCVIHYTEEFFNRPWRVECTHPFRDCFLKYQEKTPFTFPLENVRLSRNAAIMQWVNLHLPFFAYVLIMNLITMKKRIEYRK